jgi:hypothetical protein
MNETPNPANRSLPPEIVAAIDAALSNLERTHPGVSTDPQIRSEVHARVGAALASLEALEPAALAGVTAANMRPALE